MHLRIQGGGQGRRFAKWVVGAEPVKTAQSTVIILQFNDFSVGFDTFFGSSEGF